MRDRFCILVVDDDDVDTALIRRAFKQNGFTNPLQTARHGEEALDILRRALAPGASERDVPGLILLDLNMPVLNGVELIRQLKSHPELRSIPVVVLTTSDAEADLAETYRLGIAGYIVKPLEFSKFVDAVQTLGYYWSMCARPQRGFASLPS